MRAFLQEWLTGSSGTWSPWFFTDSSPGWILWWVVAVPTALLWAGAPLLAAVSAWSPEGGCTSGERGSRRGTWLRLTGVGGSLAVVAFFVPRAIEADGAYFHLSPESSGFFTVAAICARGGPCPLFGQPSIYGFHLPPLFYQILAPLEFTGDPGTTFLVLVETQTWLAAAVLGVGISLALRSPWGALPALSVVFGSVLRHQFHGAEHAPLALLPAAGFVVASLAWVRDGRPWVLVTASACLATAAALHAIMLPLVLVLLAAALAGRASRRTLGLTVLPWGLVLAPWLIVQVATAAADLRHPFGFNRAFLGSSGWLLWPLPHLFDVDLRWPVFLGLVGAWIEGLRRASGSQERRLAGTALLLAAVALACHAAGASAWQSRYSFLLIVALAPAAAFGPHAVTRWIAEQFRRGRGWMGKAGTLLLALGVLGAWLPPLQRVTTTRFEPSRWDEGYEVIREIGEFLAGEGFTVPDFESRVHGTAWARGFAPGWLGVRSGTRLPADEPLEAVVLAGRDLPAGFALASRRLTRTESPLVVATYRPRLTSFTAVVRHEDGTESRLVRPVPLDERPVNYVQHDSEFARRSLVHLHPGLAPTEEELTFRRVWQRRGPRRLSIQTTMRAGSGNRQLVVAHARGWEIRVRLDREPVTPLQIETAEEDLVLHAVFRVANGRDVAVEVEVSVPLEPGLPYRLSLYERPEA